MIIMALLGLLLLFIKSYLQKSGSIPLHNFWGKYFFQSITIVEWIYVLKSFWKKVKVLKLKVSWYLISHWYLEPIVNKKWRMHLVLFLSTSSLSVQLCILVLIESVTHMLNQISLFLLNIHIHAYIFFLLFVVHISMHF